MEEPLSGGKSMARLSSWLQPVGVGAEAMDPRLIRTETVRPRLPMETHPARADKMERMEFRRVHTTVMPAEGGVRKVSPVGEVVVLVAEAEEIITGLAEQADIPEVVAEVVEAKAEGEAVPTTQGPTKSIKPE